MKLLLSLIFLSTLSLHAQFYGDFNEEKCSFNTLEGAPSSIFVGRVCYGEAKLSDLTGDSYPAIKVFYTADDKDSVVLIINDISVTEDNLSGYASNYQIVKGKVVKEAVINLRFNDKGSVMGVSGPGPRGHYYDVSFE